MKDPREKLAKGIMKQIHDVLWKDWDPIGVNDAAPEDEYDSYIGGVYRLLASGCTRGALVNHLLRIELDTMALGPMAPGSESRHTRRLERVADKLMAIDLLMNNERGSIGIGSPIAEPPPAGQ